MSEELSRNGLVDNGRSGRTETDGEGLRAERFLKGLFDLRPMLG